MGSVAIAIVLDSRGLQIIVSAEHDCLALSASRCCTSLFHSQSSDLLTCVIEASVKHKQLQIILYISSGSPSNGDLLTCFFQFGEQRRKHPMGAVQERRLKGVQSWNAFDGSMKKHAFLEGRRIKMVPQWRRQCFDRATYKSLVLPARELLVVILTITHKGREREYLTRIRNKSELKNPLERAIRR